MASIEERMIEHTREPMRHPWPADVQVQGGARGIVIKLGDGSGYDAAFVEAFPFGTFLRGEGKTVAEAEGQCWARYVRARDCPSAPAHGPFDAGSYENGSGFCVPCGTWFPGVIPPPADDPDEPPTTITLPVGDLL